MTDLSFDKLAIPPAPNASYPLRAGNLLRPLIDGEPAFRRICEAIEAAKHAREAETLTEDEQSWLDEAMPTILDECGEMPDYRPDPDDVRLMAINTALNA